MPDEHGQTPTPEWRLAQHRIRNDLQTLAALLRLSRRRAPDNVLLDEYPEWLNAMAALYDALPLWDAREEVSLHAVAAALRQRCQFSKQVTLVESSPVLVSSASALAAALGILGLIHFSCRNARAGSTVTVGVSADEGAARVEATFQAAGTSLTGWPPLSLSLAVEAMDGRIATSHDADNTVAAMFIPRS